MRSVHHHHACQNTINVDPGPTTAASFARNRSAKLRQGMTLITAESHAPHCITNISWSVIVSQHANSSAIERLLVGAEDNGAKKDIVEVIRLPADIVHRRSKHQGNFLDIDRVGLRDLHRSIAAITIGGGDVLTTEGLHVGFAHQRLGRHHCIALGSCKIVPMRLAIIGPISPLLGAGVFGIVAIEDIFDLILLNPDQAAPPSANLRAAGSIACSVIVHRQNRFRIISAHDQFVAAPLDLRIGVLPTNQQSNGDKRPVQISESVAIFYVAATAIQVPQRRHHQPVADLVQHSRNHPYDENRRREQEPAQAHHERARLLHILSTEDLIHWVLQKVDGRSYHESAVLSTCYNTRMLVAFIGQKGVLPSEKAGGIERRVFEIGRRLVDLGHSVTVYARKRHMPGQPKYVEGMQMLYIPTVYQKNVEAIIYTFFATWHAIFRGYDIYHFHGVGPSTLAILPRIFRPNKKVIITFHARDQFHQKWSWFGRNYLRFGEWASLHFPHYTIAVSHALQVLARDTYGVQTVYIPNGAEPQFVTADNYLSALGIRPRKYFLTVGRIIKVKGIQHLIKAYRQIKTDFELIIVGDGEPDFIKELTELARGDERVRFLGFKKGEELGQLYAHTYVYVQPSESEGLPLTVLEAMSNGVATLVSNIPGNLEAIYRTGFTFKNTDVEDLAKELAWTLKYPEKVTEQGEEARAVIETKFSWDTIAHHEEELYITCYH